MSTKKELKFELINVIGIVSNSTKGWKKELTRVSWNGEEPKYDIRTWDEEHDKMGKGVTLSVEELRNLKKLIDDEIRFLDDNND